MAKWPWSPAPRAGWARPWPPRWPKRARTSWPSTAPAAASPQSRSRSRAAAAVPSSATCWQATPADLSQVVDEVVREMGRLDILVNNAGIIRRAPVLEFSEKDWDDVLQINLKARLLPLAGRGARDGQAGRRQDHQHRLDAVLPGRHPHPLLYRHQERRRRADPRCWPTSWPRKGINVNAIAPGYMATDNTAPLRADEQRAATILERIPAGRWGEPSDLQGAVVFLASPPPIT